MEKEKITEIVTATVSTLIETFPVDQRFKVDQNTVLFGKGSQIDSLSLVSIIVNLETTFYSDYNMDISLADDRAMLRTKSPYDSIGALVDYIDELINKIDV